MQCLVRECTRKQTESGFCKYHTKLLTMETVLPKFFVQQSPYLLYGTGIITTVMGLISWSPSLILIGAMILMFTWLGCAVLFTELNNSLEGGSV